jgi:predicted nucleic acid-binding protein
MNPISHVFDTSAILAHYFNEPGASIVDGLWADGSSRIGISAVTVAELRGRLFQEIADEAEASRAADAYLNELTICLPVDRVIAELAWQLRHAVPTRLPLIDALIAATARSVGAVLVHMDTHMAGIPTALVAQIVLSDKSKP